MAIVHRMHRAGANAEFGAFALQQGDRAAAPLAKGEIAAGDHAGGAKLAGQNVADPAFGRHIGHRRIEVEHQGRIGAGCGKHVAALFDGGEAEGRGIGHEIADRVRGKGGDDGGAALGTGPAQGLAKYGLMAAVKAIEIAQRNNGAAQGFRKGLAGIEANHAGEPIVSGRV